MQKIFAVVETFNAGHDYEEDIMRKTFKLKQKIEVDSIIVHSWHTEFFLKGYKNSFNSVFFAVFDEEGNELDFMYGEACEYLRIDNY